jgi:hypothetical protein
MTRLFMASIAVVSALAVVPYAVKAQKPPPKKDAMPKSNQVYVKIILPIDPAKRDKDLPVVESWIAEQLKKIGQTKFTAATAWVPLAGKGDKFEFPKEVWDGNLKGMQSQCPVLGNIVERADGRVTVRLRGWGPIGDTVTVSLTDDPGSREIAAGEYLDPETEQRRPFAYVAVLIGPPPEKPAAPTDHKK